MTFSDKVIIIILASVAIARSNMPWFYVWYSIGRLNMHQGLQFAKDTPSRVSKGMSFVRICVKNWPRSNGTILKMYINLHMYIYIYIYIYVYICIHTIYIYKSKIFCNVPAVVFGDLLMAITKCHLVKPYAIRNMWQQRSSQWLIVHWHTTIPWTTIDPPAGS